MKTDAAAFFECKTLFEKIDELEIKQFDIQYTYSILGAFLAPF